MRRGAAAIASSAARDVITGKPALKLSAAISSLGSAPLMLSGCACSAFEAAAPSFVAFLTEPPLSFAHCPGPPCATTISNDTNAGGVNFTKPRDTKKGVIGSQF